MHSKAVSQCGPHPLLSLSSHSSSICILWVTYTGLLLPSIDHRLLLAFSLGMQHSSSFPSKSLLPAEDITTPASTQLTRHCVLLSLFTTVSMFSSKYLTHF